MHFKRISNTFETGAKLNITNTIKEPQMAEEVKSESEVPGRQMMIVLEYVFGKFKALQSGYVFHIGLRKAGRI